MASEFWERARVGAAGAGNIGEGGAFVLGSYLIDSTLIPDVGKEFIGGVQDFGDAVIKFHGVGEAAKTGALGLWHSVWNIHALPSIVIGFASIPYFAKGKVEVVHALTGK